MFGLIRRFTNKMKREIVINSERFETRVAVLENGKLEEFRVEHPSQERLVGSVFKGRIQNLENDLQAAFVDIGFKKNAFLHYWDMIPDDEMRDDIEDNGRHKRTPKKKRVSNEEIARMFPVNSEIVVQVTKGAIGTKGPRVTADLSIPGRYLVLMPGSRLKGVSRKIADDAERQRLKKLLSRLEVPAEMGLIVRTAAQGASRRNLDKDVHALIETWAEIRKSIADRPSPCCVYEEPDLVERVVRDWLTEDVDRIIVDSREEFDRIREIARRISRKAKSSVHLYEGELPIFEHFGVERQLEETGRRKVMLKSGGCVVFDETEALIAVDVNTGRHKGTGSQEETILQVNTEAVEEVARQLRLRNIGGLVVIDLIDMSSRRSQAAVYKAMKEAVKRDRARTNVLSISELGLMEMTRQRAEESLTSSMYSDCPYCHGRGSVKSPWAMSVEIQRQISALMRRHKKNDPRPELSIVVHPNVLDRLRREDEEFLMDLESRYEGRLSFRSDPSRHMEFFSITNALTHEVLYSSVDR